MSSKRPRVKATPPYLIVSGLDQSIAYYRNLGFDERAVWGEPPCFAMLSRDGFDLMLRLADSPEQIRPNGDFGAWDVCILVEDALAEAAELGSVGVQLTRAPTETTYIRNDRARCR